MESLGALLRRQSKARLYFDAVCMAVIVMHKPVKKYDNASWLDE